MNPEDQFAQAPVGQMNDQPPQFIRAGTTVQLPYHINPETGTGYELQVEADTPVPVFQAEVDRLFPKTLASLATQLLDKSPDAPLLSKEDFMQVWNSAQAMDAGKTEKQNQIKGGPGFWKAGYDVIREAIHSIGTGAAEASQTLGQVGTAIADMNPNAAASAGVKLLNGLMTGTGRLSDSAKVLGALVWDKIAGDPYSVYKAGKDAQYAEYLRKTQGFQMVPGSTPQEIEAGLQLGNVMDITVLLPAVSALTKGMSKAGQVAAEQTVEELTKAMTQRSAESIGRRALGQAVETIGRGVEFAGSLSAIGDSLAKGFLRTEGARQAAGIGTGVGAIAASTIMPEGYGSDVLKAYGTLRMAQIGGAGMKWAGKILGSEELASKITQEALRSAQVQGAERLAVKLVKNIPDPVVRMTRKVLDGAMIPAAIGATLSGAQEASDPFSSPLDVVEAGVLGGLGGAAVGGFIGGAIGLGGEVTGKAREQSFVREIMTDIATRPEQRSFVVGNQDIVVPDDIQNRVSVLNTDRLTTRQKASLFGILDSAEHAGIDVAFINDSTPLPDFLGGSGANMGKGVKFVNDAGRKTIFINADQITHTGAIHEVTHAYIGDEIASDFVRNLTKERGGEVGAFQELSTFAQRYYDTQVQTNPEAAAQIKASIDRMNDPQVPLQDRLVAATNIAHEYMAEGISQSLADAKPESLQDFRGSAISAAADRAFQGAIKKINTSFGMSSVGATHDPISGHFFKDGQIISSQPIADITKKVQTAIKTRTEVPVSAESVERPFVPKDAPVPGETLPTGGRVVAVEPRATYEDTHKDGSLTKESEKKKYHKMVWNQATQFMGNEAAKDVIIQQGVYPGNISEGTPIIYTDKLTPQHISGLFQVQTHHGRPLIAPENRESVARFAQALNDGHLVSVTHSVNTSKSTGKDRAYSVSVNQIGLPMAFSMSSGRKGSGPKMEFFNLSLVNDMVNLNRTLSPAIDAALKDLKVASLDDAIPYAKAYIDNLSSTGSVPSVRALASVAPTGVKPKSLEFMRDMLHLSSGIQPRESRGEVRINEPFATSEQFLKYSNPELVAVTPTGQKFKTTLSRDRAVVQSVRLDGVTDVQLYQPNGTPVQITVNKPQLVNKVRANFSPATSNREPLPNGEAITDNESGQRIIVSPKGRAKLFDSQGKLVGVFEDEDAAILKSNQDKLKQQQVRFAPATTAAERRAAERAAEERKYGVPSTTPNLATFDAEAITKARNEIVREGTPTFVGKVADPEFTERLQRSQAVLAKAQAEDALTKRVNQVARKRREIQRRQAEIEAAVAAQEASGNLGPVEVAKIQKETRTLKGLEDLPGYIPGSPTRLPADQPAFTLEQFRRAISNDYFEQFPQPQEVPTPVTDLISKKMSRAEITHRTVLGNIQAEAAKAARIGDMKIEKALAAMSEKREAMFDAELARIENKFKTMEVERNAEKARQARVDMDIVRRRQEHFANVQQQIAQVTEPAPLNSGPVEPPQQTVLPNIATAADDPRIPRDFVIQESRGKFRIWSIGRQAVQAVTDTYQEALKKAQAIQLKRRKKKNAA